MHDEIKGVHVLVLSTKTSRQSLQKCSQGEYEAHRLNVRTDRLHLTDRLFCGCVGQDNGPHGQYKEMLCTDID